MDKTVLFNLTSPRGMFTPDAISKVTSYTGIERLVYKKNIGRNVICSDSLESLEFMVKNYNPINNDGAKHDYNNGSNFNND